MQRVPVRIALDPQELTDHPLRVGLSVSAEVDVHDQSGPLVTSKVGAGTTRANTGEDSGPGGRCHDRAHPDGQRRSRAVSAAGAP